LVLIGRILLASASRGAAQQTFATGEAQRVYTLLEGLGCITFNNATCQLRDFTPSSECSVDIKAWLSCDSQGYVVHL
jgi:hypothetical protein